MSTVADDEALITKEQVDAGEDLPSEQQPKETEESDDIDNPGVETENNEEEHKEGAEAPNDDKEPESNNDQE